MNFPIPRNLQLRARNEGKIKSYESCDDIRAWSHDVGDRDRYLREWIKCDMPFCVIPVSSLAGFLRAMTCKSRCRATPRCHPDCKSKVVLDSISNSCYAMKECLKNDACFDKYFEEEEFETSHWPCDRCLEALKSIKMFWKIIAEKLFNINLSKNVEREDAVRCCNESVRDVAKLWQKDMVHKAFIVNTNSQLHCPALSRGKCSCKSKCTTKDTYCRKKAVSEGDACSILMRKISKNTINSKRSRANMRDNYMRKNDTLPHRRLCKCTSVKVKTIDIGCDAKENEDFEAYKMNLQIVEKYKDQRCAIERLTRENTSLKAQLQKCNNIKWKTTLYCPEICRNDSIPLIPKPFECCVEDSEPKGTDSEMIITMKNCKNQSFRHVSFLQVLHKTNEPILKDVNFENIAYKKEDPINLLTKVHKTLGAIVKREMTIATERGQERKSDIMATFQNVNSCRSVSCSTVSSRYCIAGDQNRVSNFESATLGSAARALFNKRDNDNDNSECEQEVEKSRYH